MVKPVDGNLSIPHTQIVYMDGSHPASHEMKTQSKAWIMGGESVGYIKSIAPQDIARRIRRGGIGHRRGRETQGDWEFGHTANGWRRP